MTGTRLNLTRWQKGKQIRSAKKFVASQKHHKGNCEKNRHHHLETTAADSLQHLIETNKAGQKKENNTTKNKH